MSDRDRLLLHLSLISGIGPGTIGSLLERETQDIPLELLYQLSSIDIARCYRLGPVAAEKIWRGLRSDKDISQELDLLELHNITVLTRESEAYPELLGYIPFPPAILYVKGKLDKAMRALAIVGSRKATSYGKRIIDHFVPALVDQGLAIVSGGAYGIDSMAHRATLQAGGITIAVLGSGLLRPYPAENRSLFEEIVAHEGALVSPFPLTMGPERGNFPARNRIIAGLSLGSIVVQAAAQSGALITATHALEQGRYVFAVPGTFDDVLAAGCHALINQGACLATSPYDIVQELGLVAMSIKEKKSELQVIDEPQGLDREQQVILELCAQPRSTQELLVRVGCDMSALSSHLFDLQFAGRVTQDHAGLWVAIG